MNRDEKINRLASLDFMMEDLALYLNTHNSDTEAIARYNKIAKKALALRQEYETEFGPLMSASFVNPSDTEWVWVKGTWPWNKTE